MKYLYKVKVGSFSKVVRAANYAEAIQRLPKLFKHFLDSATTCNKDIHIEYLDFEITK